MASVSEWVVREYFELLGFLVNQPCKHSVPGRQKTADEEVDLVVFNPRAGESARRVDRLVWTTADLRHVKRAVVGIRGWHTERFYASTFEQSPDILRFIEADSIRFAAKVLGSSSLCRVLCLPKLPASAGLREQALGLLKRRGIDGVLTFGTILSELILQADVNRNYEKSDLLQVVRLLKNYDFIKDTQLEFFTKKRKRRRGQTFN